MNGGNEFHGHHGPDHVAPMNRPSDRMSTTDLDMHTAPEPCQQAVTDVLDRLHDQIRHMAQDSNGFVSVASVRRQLRLIRSIR